MMTYFLDTHPDTDEPYSPSINSLAVMERTGSEQASVHLLTEKLQIPSFRSLIDRPRLTDLLQRSTEKFPATLVTGRAGTGKTAVAAVFSRTKDHAAWYSVESSDVDWHIFANYFAACVLNAIGSETEPHTLVPEARASQSSMASFLVN